MGDRCDLSGVEPGASACGACGEPGAVVRLRTVKALLTEVALRRVRLTLYRFCGNPGCDVVYFGDAGDHFDASDLRVPVWHKEQEGARLLCYCFGETESVIRSELVEHGRTAVVDRIRQHIAAQRCACDLRNPRGACCLGDVMAAVKLIERRLLARRKTDGRSYGIGEIANQTGVSVETLRYYEKRRLLKIPPRTEGGFRRYSANVVQQIRFIKQAQSLGLTLDDIRQLVTGQQRRSRAPSCRRVRELLTRRIDDIEGRIKELRSFRRTLHEHLVVCEQALAAATEPACPTIEALERPKGASKAYEAR